MNTNNNKSENNDKIVIILDKQLILTILLSVIAISTAIITIIYVSSECKHKEWNEANCIKPKTCAKCGYTEGEPLGHDWNYGTNDDYASCSNCDEKAELISAVNESNNYSHSENHSSNSSNNYKNDEFYCMGKNDTCNNKTSSAYDLYCYSCDPDNNNIEGDQSYSHSNSYSYHSKSDGKVRDNDYDGDIDESDWEDAWSKFLNDKLDEYGY